MGDVVEAVKSVVNEGAKAVNNITAEAGKGFDNLVKGDVGKAATALVTPQLGMVAAAGDVLKGDIKGAVGRAAGAQLSANTNLLGVSSDVKKFVESNDTLNDVTLGMSKDAVKMHDSTNRMIATGEVRDQDISNILRASTRAAVIGSGVGLVAGGGASTIGSTAVNAGKSGVGFLQSAGSVAAGAAAIAKDPGKAAASYLGIDTSGLDDTLNDLNDIRNNVDTVRTIISPPANQRAPSATGSPGGTAGLAAQAAGGSLIPIILMVAGGLLALVFILKRKGK